MLSVKPDGPGRAHFDYISDFQVTQPILSLTTTTERCYEDGSEVFHLFTVQVCARGSECVFVCVSVCVWM